MKDEAISSSAEQLLRRRSPSPPHTPTPAASSAGASSPAVPANAGSTDWFDQGQNSKAGSLSLVGSMPMCTSLSASAGDSALESSQPSCRPWERGDLLRRLSTFKPSNWFGKPKPVSSLACARRGWVNVDVDRIECESCGAILTFVSSSTWTTSQAECAGEEFAKRLDGGHSVTCPWIGNCCADSLVQFPPTPPSALIGGYKDRCDGLLQFSLLPIVATSAIVQMQVSRCQEIDRLLAQSLFTGNESGMKFEIILGSEATREDLVRYSQAQKLISLCGWEPRWLPNVQDCEEHSAQSARNGYSNGPARYRGLPRDPGRGKKPLCSSSKKGRSVNKVTGAYSKSVSRSPLLDCSLCGATVRIWDFLTVKRPACHVPSVIDVPETSKKMMLTRGVSAASGISGWVAADGAEKEHIEDHNEGTDEGKSPSNAGIDLNITISAAVSSSHMHVNVMPEQFDDIHRGRDLLIGQPSSSEVGDRATSYESRGPSSRKRNLDEGGSTVDIPQLFTQQADSVEGTVIDRDGDEVDDGKQYMAGPSKRFRDINAIEPHLSSLMKTSSGAGPSQLFGFDLGTSYASKDDFYDPGHEQLACNPSTRDSTHVSSVIAMDTICHSTDSDSMESVENYPVDFDDVHLPSTSAIKNTDPNDTTECNYSNQAQMSACPTAVRSTGEMGISSTNEEVLNADTATAQGRDGPSFGISGGSVGMGASHEAEIHGNGASLYQIDSAVADVEAVAEITDVQGQTGEFAPDPGVMGDFVPEELDREYLHGDSQDIISRALGRADSGSKIAGSANKTESVESGEKTSSMRVTTHENSPCPSLSRNAILCSGFEVSKEEVTQAAKDQTTDDCGYVESGYGAAGPPNGDSNYDVAIEFDPIKHHNYFCPWVNGNVAAAGCGSSSGSSSGAVTLALCGWQLTLDALEAFQSLGQVPIQNLESESAASMHKDDHITPSRKLLARQSLSKSRGKK